MQKLISALSLIFIITNSQAQDIPYGNNPAAAHYVNVGDANIYYETYGKGKPLVMLHGGVYGYIDEFASFIPKLSENFQVICIATRGHGKSGIGNKPYTYKQRADDAYKIIRGITKDSVIVIGFSDGGMSAMKLASLYPEVVSKLIVMGVGDRPQKWKHEKINYTAEKLMKTDSLFFASRLKLMPEPGRWQESLTRLSLMYNTDYMSKETFNKINCPVLLMNGDHDGYSSIDEFIQCSKYIRNARVALIPGCSHVIFFCNFPAVWASIDPFLQDGNSLSKRPAEYYDDYDLSCPQVACLKTNNMIYHSTISDLFFSNISHKPAEPKGYYRCIPNLKSRNSKMIRKAVQVLALLLQVLTCRPAME